MNVPLAMATAFPSPNRRMASQSCATPLNKGTAFTEEERDALGLRGLLPPMCSPGGAGHARDGQSPAPARRPREIRCAERAARPQRGAVLPRRRATTSTRCSRIIYTPTVGLACQKFGHIFQRPRGIFISADDRGRIAEMLRNWPHRDEAHRGHRRRAHPRPGRPRRQRHGHPGRQALALLRLRRRAPDALPAGHARRRHQQRGAAATIRSTSACASTGCAAPPTTSCVEEFVAAAREVFPGVVIQFEDFANHNAFRLLQKYRDRVCVFNDDIQGTAAVALAGIFSALRITGGKLADQTLLFLGAGEAATGIADLVVSAMVAQGLSTSAGARGATGSSTRAAWWSKAAQRPRRAQAAVCARACAGRRLRRRRSAR